jgi:hypothetical protein
MDELEIIPPQSGYLVPRRWGRYRPAVPVRVRIPRLLDTVTLAAWALELNCGGMALYGLDHYGVDLPIGRQIEVEFVSPSSGQLRKLWCVVGNRQDHRHGLEFLFEDGTD